MVEEDSLSARSRALARAVFRAFPDWKALAKSETHAGDHERHLRIEVPSPTGDPRRDLCVWIDEEGEPSVGFGGWHTHSSVLVSSGEDEVSGILSLLQAIVSDRFVITHEAGLSEGLDPWGVIDLRETEAIEEILTSKDAGHALSLLSWTGAADRTITLKDLRL